MIERYNKPEISTLWNDHSKYSTYLEAELAILKSLEGNQVPVGTSDKVKEKAIINSDRIDEIERTTRHDVIAFCTSITENLDTEVAKFFHFGVTSSDIIDTALTLQIKTSMEVILPKYEALLKNLHERSVEMKNVITMGRSHGMYAEPMSFGQKLLSFYNEFARRYYELKDFYDNELTIQFSGAVGNYTILTTENEKSAAKTLGVKVEPLSTQVIPRDRIAKLISINALVGCALERLSIEIRHLHRSDVGELHEGFKKGQKGSSIMPHKKNPISGENLTGMARMLRSHVQIAMDNTLLWHERDISHSSAERMYLPDNFGIMAYALDRMSSTVRDLVFHQEVIEERVKNEHGYLSSFYLHHLIEHTDIKREDLYYYVQEAAFAAAKDGKAETFHNTLTNAMAKLDYKINLPSPSFDQIKNIYLKEVDAVFKRSLESYPLP